MADFDLELSVSGQNGDPNIDSSMDITLDGDVFGGGGDDKAYTAMTTDASKVEIELDGDYSSGSAPVGGAVADWWDGLSDSDKIANLNAGY